jgi:hypothetical protein
LRAIAEVKINLETSKSLRQPHLPFGRYILGAIAGAYG